MNYIAKTRVGLSADGKTLVDADCEDAVSLVAAKGATIPAKYVEGKANLAKFFTKQGEKDDDKAVAKTHSEPEGSKRVVAQAEPAKAHPAHVKR